VYTWWAKKSRYETAYIENDLCGALPIRLGKGPAGEPEFRFREMGSSKEDRVYHLIQTVIRREKQESDKSTAGARKGKKAKH
jgi:hypothetical protein